MGLPSTLNLQVYAGDDFSQTLRLKVGEEYIDLTGATIEAQVRQKFDSEEPMATFDVDVGDQDDDDEKGLFTLSLPNETTTDMTSGKWDVQIVALDGKIKTYLRGAVQVAKQVTR